MLSTLRDGGERLRCSRWGVSRSGLKLYLWFEGEPLLRRLSSAPLSPSLFFPLRARPSHPASTRNPSSHYSTKAQPPSTRCRQVVLLLHAFALKLITRWTGNAETSCGGTQQSYKSCDDVLHGYSSKRPRHSPLKVPVLSFTPPALLASAGFPAAHRHHRTINNASSPLPFPLRGLLPSNSVS